MLVEHAEQYYFAFWLIANSKYKINIKDIGLVYVV